MSHTHNTVFDLAIIGGGINGAAIARDAALRGITVVLFEKEDYGAGASSKSSKLVHGGIRYLEKFQIGLVRESLKERALLLKNAPHIVHPLSFYLPVYARDKHPLWQIGLGLFFYDHLGGSGALSKHRKVDVDSIAAQFPGIETAGLRGGCIYHDAQMLDNRLVIENILAAEMAGALVYNHTPVTSLIMENGNIRGLRFRHATTGKEESIRARTVVNASGAWSAQIAGMEPGVPHLVPVPTKGVHLVVPKIASEAAILLHAPQDGRVFFVMPWGNYSLIGTTDTFYQGNPDQVDVDDVDVDYLLHAVNFYFPQKNLHKTSVVATFAGLRPLAASGEVTAPSDIIREHVIDVSKGGMITILGGKFTTHRHIAEQVVDRVVSLLGSEGSYRQCMTADLPLPGAAGPYTLPQVKEQLQNAGLQQDVIDHLMNTYGTLSMQILAIIQADPQTAQKLCSEHPHTVAELIYAVKHEHASTMEDWFCRRTTIAYTSCRGLMCQEATAAKMASLSNSI